MPSLLSDNDTVNLSQIWGIDDESEKELDLERNGGSSMVMSLGSN